MQKELLELCDRHCMGIQGRDICAYFLAESGKLHINYYVPHAQTYLCVFVSHTEIFIKTQKLLLGAHSVIKDQLVVIHAHQYNSYERCSEILKLPNTWQTILCYCGKIACAALIRRRVFCELYCVFLLNVGLGRISAIVLVNLPAEFIIGACRHQYDVPVVDPGQTWRAMT